MHETITPLSYRISGFRIINLFSLDTSVTHLKFVVREDADSLVVAVNSDSGGIVEVWELREKSQPVHKMFQPKTLEPFKTVVVCEFSLYLP